MRLLATVGSSVVMVTAEVYELTSRSDRKAAALIVALVLREGGAGRINLTPADTPPQNSWKSCSEANQVLTDLLIRVIE